MKTHEIAIFGNSQLVKSQRKSIAKVVRIDGKEHCIIAEIRWDDECNNKHNTFSITGKMGRIYSGYSQEHFTHNGKKYLYETGGCIHDEIREHFPELRHLIKYHLASSNAPMYFFENSQYWAKKGDLKNASSCAIWEGATIDEILDDEKMFEHLNKLMPKFKSEIENFGFIW